LDGLPHLFYHRAYWKDRLVPLRVLNAYSKETQLLCGYCS